MAKGFTMGHPSPTGGLGHALHIETNLSLAEKITAIINERHLTPEHFPTVAGGVVTPLHQFIPHGHFVVEQAGDLTILMTDRAGTIVGGNGDDKVAIEPDDARSWKIALGSGNDAVTLGGGKSTVFVQGAETITAGSGKASLVDERNLSFIGGSAPSTVLGEGMTTIFGAMADPQVHATETVTMIECDHTLDGGHRVGMVDLSQQGADNNDFGNKPTMPISVLSEMPSVQQLMGAGRTVTLDDHTKITFTDHHS
jgi:hypothetical protein